MITKLGILKLGEVSLKEHQQRVIDKLYQPDQHGVIAYHSMGSGKTLTALEALRRAKGDKLVITPASLVDNVYKESKKHGIPLGNDTRVLSYESAVRNIDDLLSRPYGMVVFDEAHRLRNTNTTRSTKLRSLADNSDKVLMLTGTAGYNHPADIGALINIADKSAKFPDTHGDFEQRYIDPTTWKLKNTKELGDKLKKYVDIYDTPTNSSDFPTVTQKIIHVPMSDKQREAYDLAEADMPRSLRKAVSNNLPITLQDAVSLNMFSTGVRQASDSPMHHDTTAVPEDSPKLVTAVNNMAEAAKAPYFRGVAYSNYLDAGINPYVELLKKKGIDPLVFTGKLNAKQKKELIDEYNDTKNKKPKVLVLSSSGGEGLDLKGTRLLQVLEPHFNEAKLNQVKARGARYQSHSHLPEDQRNMLIEQYHSVMPKRWYHKLLRMQPSTAIDDYLYDNAVKKQNIINDIKRLASEDTI